jgi:hypothetical protein
MFKLHLRTLGLLAIFIPSLGMADTIFYGNKIGTTMKFLDIQETALSAGDTAPLFGSPTLSGDSLIFSHMSFSSSANNGASDITDGKLDTTIEAKDNPGFYIDQIRFREFGDTTLAGTGSSATRSSVAGNIYVTVLDVDQGSLPFPEVITIPMAASEGGAWTLAGGQLTGHQWNGTLDLNLSGILQERGINAHARLICLTLENTLTTSSEIGTSAFIAKKLEGLSVTPMLVPEPGSLSLLLLGGLLFRRRR